MRLFFYGFDFQVCLLSEIGLPLLTYKSSGSIGVKVVHIVQSYFSMIVVWPSFKLVSCDIVCLMLITHSVSVQFYKDK